MIILKYKLFYLFKFLSGFVFIAAVLILLYYLNIFFSDSWFGYVTALLFGIFVISAIRVIFTMPREIKILIEILKSDSPKEVDDFYSDLRMHNRL